MPLKSNSIPSAEADMRIGTTLRHTRLLKGMTLKRLAEIAECSESLLSKIENGRANPSLKMVHRLAAALGTPVAGLFRQHADGDEIVLRNGERPIIETDQVRAGHGIQLEAVIADSPGHLLSGVINHIAPGGGSAGEFRHDGEEFGYVLEGEIELKVSGKRYRVGRGDCFHFRSERVHSYRNIGDEVARVLWLNTPPTF